MKQSYFRKVFAIAFPLMLQQLIFELQGGINRVFLGNLDPIYLSVVTNAVFPFFAIASLIWSLSSGASILVSQYRGAGKPESALSVAESAVPFLSLLGLAFMLLWFCFPGLLLGVLGNTGRVLDLTSSYVQILSFWFLLLGFEGAAIAFLQGSGNTRPLLVSGILKVVLNVILDWLLIFGNCGFPRMEVMGSAWATLISTILADVYLFYYVLKKRDDGWHLRLKGIFRPSVAEFRKMATLGIPASLESLLWFAGMLILLRILNGLDVLAAGIFGLIFFIEVIPGQMHDGIGRAGSTLVGEQKGAGDHRQARSIGLRCLRYSLTFSAGVALAFLLLPVPILGLFTTDTALVQSTVIFLYIAGFTVFFRGGNIVIGGGIRGLGDTPWMLMTQIVGTFVFIGVLAWVLAITLGWGLLGVFVALSLDEFLRFLINFGRFRWGRPAVLERWLKRTPLAEPSV